MISSCTHRQKIIIGLERPSRHCHCFHLPHHFLHLLKIRANALILLKKILSPCPASLALRKVIGTTSSLSSASSSSDASPAACRCSILVIRPSPTEVPQYILLSHGSVPGSQDSPCQGWSWLESAKFQQEGFHFIDSSIRWPGRDRTGKNFSSNYSQC